MGGIWLFLFLFLFVLVYFVELFLETGLEIRGLVLALGVPYFFLSINVVYI